MNFNIWIMRQSQLYIIRYKRKPLQSIRQKMSKLTEKDLQEKIIDERFENYDLYYSLTEKEGSTFGLNTTRLLVFSKGEDQLFYLVKDQKVPFLNAKNYTKGKKDRAKVSIALFQNPPKTNKIIVKYTKDNTSREWKFTMKTQGLAQDWVLLLNQHKQSIHKKPKLVGDTIISHLQKNQKQQNEKDEQEQAMETFLLKNSHHSYTKQPDTKKDQRESIKNSQVKPNNNNTNQSRLRPNDSRIKPNNNTNNSQFRSNNTSRVEENNANNSRIREENQKPQNQNQVKNDWNYKFVKERSLKTILDFQDACDKLFSSFIQDDRSSDLQMRKYSQKNITAYFADVQTPQARELKREFRNYHYILQCFKDSQLLGVPLCCLIQKYGLVALFKADFPQKVAVLQDKMNASAYLQDIQELTKINSNIIYYSDCVILNLTDEYGSVGKNQRLFIQNLLEYLPELATTTNQKQTPDFYMIRPQMLQYNVDKIITGGILEPTSSNHNQNHKSKSKFEFEKLLETQIRDAADFLSREEIYVTNIFDLKEYLHYRGINMKMLPKVSQATSNKFIKRYIDTCLVAKIIKDQINTILCNVWSSQHGPIPEKVLEGEIKSYVEGKSASNNEYWKKIALLFRKKWGFSVNTHQILGPFFLSCIMTLIPAEYDIKRLNKDKIIFEDANIIGEGFVKRILPKIKSYHRFQINSNDRVVQICKYSKEDLKVYEEIVDWLELDEKDIPEEYELNKGKLYIMAYLSEFLPPKKLNSKTLPCAEQIYDEANILCEPPSTPSIKINLNYLAFCLEYKKYQEFQNKIEKSMNIIEYWLGADHPEICEYYDKISEYEAANGNIDKCIEMLERSLEISRSTEVLNPKKIGKRYNALGSRLLKAGRKKQALANLENSRKFLQKCQQSIPEHTITLMKLSSLYLNNGDMQRCIETGRQAMTKAAKTNTKDSTTVRIFQILCRAYEINNDKQNLKKLGIECSKKFNHSQERFVFDQMVKIGLTGAFSKVTQEKSKAMLQLALMMDKEGRIKSYQQSIDELMKQAEREAVMEKFIIKCEFADRIYSDFQNKKSLSTESQDFLSLLALVSGCAGLDFLQGLNSQKQFE